VQGDSSESTEVYQFIPGSPVENKIVVWLRLGVDEEYVKNIEPPSNDEAHWRVVEELKPQGGIELLYIRSLKHCHGI
jgi:hypothetical protein